MAGIAVEGRSNLELNQFANLPITISGATQHNFRRTLHDEESYFRIRDGHQVGDLYLQQVVQRMKHQVRSIDVLVRIGGDEFTVLVAEVRSRADVEEIALRIERSFDEPVPVGGHVLHASASVGIDVYPEDALTKHGLLNVADSAMYKNLSKYPPGLIRRFIPDPSSPHPKICYPFAI